MTTTPGAARHPRRRFRGTALTAVVAVVAVTGAAGCRRPGVTPAPVAPAVGGSALVGVNPDVVTTPGAVTTRLALGTYTVPPAGADGHQMRSDIAVDVAKPCTSCLVTGLQASLEYPDGRVANIDTGQWLHHVVLASGRGPDATCPGTGPGLLGERFFASGNERTRFLLPAGYGYPIGPADRWSLMSELMNATAEPTTVTVVLTTRWVPDTTPGMHPVRPVWLDVEACGDSEVPALNGAYTYSSDWTVDVPGALIGVGGHLHDGGTHLALTQVNGPTVCDMVARYGGPGYESAAGHDHGQGTGAVTAHLSSMTQCLAPDGGHPVATLVSGRRLRLTAYYDTNVFAPHGDHPVMGIAIAYVAPP